MQRILRRLDLTEEQDLQVQGILEACKAEMEAASEAVADARKSLHEAVAEGADETAIRSAAAVLGTSIGDRAVLKSQTIAEVKKVLTPEQIEQLDQIKADFKARAEKRREQMKGYEGRPGRRGRGRGCGPRRGPGRGGPGGGYNFDRFFDAADTDGDGMLTRDELRTFRQQRRGRPGPEPEPEG
jgi:Spy/CpxP family protein refolding chaperone